MWRLCGAVKMYATLSIMCWIVVRSITIVWTSLYKQLDVYFALNVA